MTTKSRRSSRRNVLPNPFERRQFAFHVLPEEKDPMSRAKNRSLIMPTLSSRLQQLFTSRFWEYLMWIFSFCSFLPIIIGDRIPSMTIFLEITHEIAQGQFFDVVVDRFLNVDEILAALFIEVTGKIFADCRWFFYDYWNWFDLICVILNFPVKSNRKFVESSSKFSVRLARL